MKKRSRILTNFASLLFFCMAILLFYIWNNYEELRVDQANRQMWYMNHKIQIGD